MLQNKVTSYIKSHFEPKRTPLSRKFPFLLRFILFIRRKQKGISILFSRQIRFSRSYKLFPFVLARHQSILMRKLGDSHPRLQENKIINIKKAIEKLDGVVIAPNEVFSFWKIVGEISYKKGYVDGMLLSDGKVIEGVGGGICQLSNLLYWLWIHIPSETVERYHHSFDVFPDSGRVLPFGSGATLVYNTVDLQMRNTSPFSFQIHLWLTDTHLKGQIRAMEPSGEKFHVFEKNHCFIQYQNQYFRYNELYRAKKKGGIAYETEKITTNFAPVLYTVDDDYIRHQSILCISIPDIL